MTRPATVTDLSGLEKGIGYEFRNADLAFQALTHMSGAQGDTGRSASYQRLEFLGDRVLGLCVSAMLYAEYPRAAEGELSRRLADLVRKERCTEVAMAWDLGPYIRLGPGESQSGGRGRPAILADVCEALIGAVFLDGGFAGRIGGRGPGLDGADALAASGIARFKDRAAGMGPGSRPAAAGLPRSVA